MRRRLNAARFVFIFSAIVFIFVLVARADELNQIPVKGKITLVDISSEHCEACDKMLPVIQGLKNDYSGMIEVITVDFWKNPDIANRVGTNTTPTILLFDKAGNEIYRGYGVIDREVLVFQLKKAGAQ